MPTPLDILKKDKNLYYDIYVKPYQQTTPNAKDLKANLQDFTKYNTGKGINTNTLLSRENDEGQGWISSFGSGIVRGVMKAPFSLLENFGNIFNTDDTYLNKNSLQEIGGSVKSNIDKLLPIYKSPEQNHWFDDGWWAEITSSIVDSATGFVLTGALTGAAINLTGKVLGAGLTGLANYSKNKKAVDFLLSDTFKLIGESSKTVSNATLLNEAESVGIAFESAKQAYTFNYNKYLSQGYDKENAQKLAKEDAGKAGATSMAVNRLNILLNLTSASYFLNPSKLTRNILKDPTKFGKPFLLETFQEGTEEVVNEIAQDKAIYESKGGDYNFDEMLDTVFSDKGLSAFVSGTLGGGGQLALTRGYNSLTGKTAKQEKSYLEQQDQIKFINKYFEDKKIPFNSEVFSNVNDNFKLYNDLKIAYENGNKEEVEKISQKLLHHNAFNSFNNGTTEILLNNWKSLKDWVGNNQDEAKKLGYDLNQKSDNYYATKIDKAISNIELLENEYNNSQQFINNLEVYNNKAQTLLYNDILESEKKNLNNEQNKLNEILDIQRLEDGFDEESFIKSNPNLINLNSNINKLQNKVNTINKKIIELKTDNIKITSEEYQKEQKIKYEENLDKRKKEEKEKIEKLKAQKEKEKADKKITKKGEKVDNKKPTITSENINPNNTSELETVINGEQTLETTSNTIENNNSSIATQINTVIETQKNEIINNTNIPDFHHKKLFEEFTNNLESKEDKAFFDLLLKNTNNNLGDLQSLLMFLDNIDGKVIDNLSDKFYNKFKEIKEELDTVLENNKNKILDNSGYIDEIKFNKEELNLLHELFDKLKLNNTLNNPAEREDTNELPESTQEDIQVYADIIKLLPKEVVTYIENEETKLVPLYLFFNKISKLSPEINNFAKNYPQHILGMYNLYADFYDKGSKFNITKEEFQKQILPIIDNVNFETVTKSNLNNNTHSNLKLINNENVDEIDVLKGVGYLFADTVNSGFNLRNREVVRYTSNGFPIYDNIDNEIKEETNKDILDINELNKGVQGHVQVNTDLLSDENNSIENIPLEFIYTNSKGITKSLTLNTIDYLEERKRISLENNNIELASFIQDEINKLTNLREHIFNNYLKNNKFETTIINKIPLSPEKTFDKKYNSLDVYFGDENLEFVIVKNNKLIISKNDNSEIELDTTKYNIINKNTFNDGATYIVLPYGKTDNKVDVMLVPISNAKIKNQEIETLSNILTLFLNNYTNNTNNLEVLNKIGNLFNLSLNQDNFNNLKTIFSKFIKLYNNDIDLEKNSYNLYKKYQEDKKNKKHINQDVLLQVTTNSIVFLDLRTGDYIKLFLNNGKIDYKYTNNNKITKNISEKQFINAFKKLLSHNLINNDINNINKKDFKLPVVKSTIKGFQFETVDYKNYNDYLKENNLTNFISFKTNDNKISYTSNVIQIDFDGILNPQKDVKKIPVKGKNKKTSKTSSKFSINNFDFKPTKSKSKKPKITKNNIDNEDDNSNNELTFDNPRELTDNEIENFNVFISNLNYLERYYELINNASLNIINLLYQNKDINVNTELSRLKNHLQNIYNSNYYKTKNLKLHSDLRLILNNFNEIEKTVKDNIKLYDKIVDFNDEDINLYIDENNINLSSFEKKFIKDGALKVNPKDTVSKNLKFFLSTIQNYDNKNKLKRDSFGLPQYQDFNIIYNEIVNVLKNIDNDFDTMLNVLEDKIKDDYKYDLLNKLKNADKQIQNQFVTAMTNHSNDMLFIYYNYYLDEKGKVQIQTIVTDSNNLNKQKVVFNNWLEKFKKSNFVKSKVINKDLNDKTEILIQDKNFIKTFLDNYNKLLEEVNNEEDTKIQDTKYKSLIKYIFENLNVDINDTLLENFEQKNNESLIKDGITYKTLNQHFNNNNGIFKNIINKIEYLLNTNEELDLSNIKNNPLDNSSVKNLAGQQSIYEKGITTNIHSNTVGDMYSSYTKNKYINTRYNFLLNNFEYYNKVKQVPFSNNSFWLSLMFDEKGNKLNNDFNLYYSDGLSQIDNKNKKAFSDLTNFEYEFYKLSLFLNNNKNTSVFMFPTAFGRTTQMMVEAQRFGIDKLLGKNGEINEILLNKLFEVLVRPELNRMTSISNLKLELEKENENRKENNLQELELKDYINNQSLLDNYNKFFIIPTLNNFEITDIDLQKNKNDTKLDDILKIELKKYLNDIINEQKLDFQDIGIIKDDILITDNQNKTTKNVNFEISNYVLENLIASVNMLQTSVGDIALFSKGVNFNDYVKENKLEKLKVSEQRNLYNKYFINESLVNLGKRLNGHNAQGQELPKNINNTFNILVIKDRKTKTVSKKYYDEIDKLFGTNISESYDNINATDAQEFITIEERLNTMISLGEINEKEYDRLLKASYDNTLTDNEISFIILPEKPVYFGETFDTVGDKVINENKIYIKSSAIPLIPQLTKNLEIDKLRKLMQDGNINRIVFNSAVKVGNQTNIPNLFNDNGTIKNITLNESEDGIVNFSVEDKILFTSKNILTLDRSNYRIQQNLPYKSETKTIDGTQQRKLLFLNVLNETFNYNNKEINGKDLYNEYKELYNDWIKLEFDKLQQELFIDGKLDNEAISKLLIEEGFKRNFSQSLKDSLIFENNNFKLPLWINSQNTRIQNLLTAIIDNRLRTLNFHGKSYVLVSEEGFKPQLKVVENGEEIQDTNIIFSDNYDKKKGLQRNQIILPFNFEYNGRKLKLQNFIKDGKIDFEKLPQDLLKMFGFRIPTQGHNSMIDIEIVGFSFTGLQDYVIASRDLVNQMGSDFDVDKLHLYSYNYEYIDGKLSKISNDENLENYKKDLVSKKIKDLENIFKPVILGLYNQISKTKKEYQKEIDEIWNKEEVELTQQDLEYINKKRLEISKEIKELEKTNNYLQKINNNKTLSLLKGFSFEEDIEYLKNQYKDLESILIRKGKQKLIENTNKNKDKTVQVLDYKIEELQKQYQESLNKILEDVNVDEKVKLLTIKQIQNKILDIHFSVLNNDTVKKQMITPVSYGELKYNDKDGKVDGIINKIKNITNKNIKSKYNSFITPLYQKNTYLNSVTALESIGIFANTSIINQFFQLSDNLQLLSINENGETFDEKFNLFGTLSKPLNDKNNNSKSKSESISAYLSSAVDNDKEQILNNVNTYTYDFIKAALLYGFDEEHIQLLLQQDIIYDYIKFNNEVNTLQIKDDDKESFKLSKENQVLNKINEKYGTKEFNQELNLTDGYNLLNNNNVNLYNEKQIKLFNVFLDLQKKGRVINKLETLITVDSKNIKNGLFYIEEVFNTYNDIKMNTNIIGFNETYDKSLNKVFFNYTYNLDNKILNQYYFQNYNKDILKTFNLAFNNLVSLLDKKFDSPVQKAQYKNIVFKEFIKFINSTNKNKLFESDINQERKRLFINEVEDGITNKKSLANLIDDFKEIYKNNYFLNKLVTDIKDNGVNTFKFTETINNDLNEVNLINSMNQLFSGNVEIELENGEKYTSRNLIQDLISSQFINGGVQSNIEFLKYIPVKYLELMGYTDYLQNLNTSDINIDNFTKQFIQHNINDVKLHKLSKLKFKRINHKDVKNETYYSFNEDINNYSKFTIPTIIKIDNFEEPFFKTKFSDFYKDVLYFYHNGYYIRHDILGNYNLNEYNFDSNYQKTIIKRNGFLENTLELNNTNPVKEKDREFFQNDNFNSKDIIDNNTTNTILNTIKTFTKDKLLLETVELLSKFDLSNIKIEIDDTIDSKGNFNPNTNIIKINSTYKFNDILETIIHEIIHSVTVNEIRNPNESNKYLVERLNKFREKIIDKIKDDYNLSNEEYNKILEKIKSKGFYKHNLNSKEISTELEKLIYYTSNIEEFFSGTLSNKDFQSYLNTIKYSDGENLLTKFYKILQKLFINLGLNIDSYLFFVNKDMYNFIDNTLNIINQNNSITLLNPKEIQNEIQYTLKSIDILQSNKAKEMFEKGQRNNWDLNKILIELQIPKEQKQLILDLGITDREQIASTIQVKQGVSELFESNPELANSAYEALGFNTIKNSSILNIYNNTDLSNAEKNEYKINIDNELYLDNSLSKDSYFGYWMPIMYQGKNIGRVRFEEKLNKINGTSVKTFNPNIQIYDAKMQEGQIDYTKKGIGTKVHIALYKYVKSKYPTRPFVSDVQNTIAEIGLLKSLEKNGVVTEINPIGKLSEKYNNYSTDEAPFIFNDDYFNNAKQITPQQKQQALQLYSQYLDTIFPDSKVKDIVYHYTDAKKFDKFVKDYIGSSVERTRVNAADSELGIFFGKKGLEGVVNKEKLGTTEIPALINIKNPNNDIYDKADEYLYSSERFIDEQEPDYDIEIEEDENGNIKNVYKEKDKLKGKDLERAWYNSYKKDLIAQGKDGVVLDNIKIVFEPEQIHILGSKQDIEGFNTFVNQPQQSDLREQIALELASKYSYTVEINTAKHKNTGYGTVEWNNEDGYQPNFDEPDDGSEENAKYYSNLTVPGGTNYTEQEISTPLITPSIKGHAQFSTDKGIGWFRSDEQLEKANTPNDKLSPYANDLKPSKTRRILEMQSDLFQKGRDSDNLTATGRVAPGFERTIVANNFAVGDILIAPNGEEVIVVQYYPATSQVFLPDENQYEPASPETLEVRDTEGKTKTYYNDSIDDLFLKSSKSPSIRQNKFLQLLNKDNNWVTFFIKSIIQSSAKQTVTEVQQEDVEAKVRELEKEGLLEIDCKGKLKAEKGLATSFTKGGKWKVIKDLKGYPTHKEGGVDLTIGKDGVNIKNGNIQFTAKHGLVIPKN